MKKAALIYLLTLFAIPATAQVLATVGKNSISVQDFNAKYKEVLEKSSSNVPTKELFLEDLIRYELGLQEARALNVANDPLVKQRFEQVMYQTLIEKQIGARVEKIQVSEKEMQEYYKSNPELRTSHILIEVPPGASAEQKREAQKRAGEILSEVKSSKKSFEELVTMYSDDEVTKRSGGDVGWQSRLTIAPEYYAAASKLKVSEISSIVETLYGFHIVKLTGRNTYEKANKRHLRQIVYDIKRKQIFDEYFAGLKKKYPVSVKKENLK